MCIKMHIDDRKKMDYSAAEKVRAEFPPVWMTGNLEEGLKLF